MLEEDKLKLIRKTPEGQSHFVSERFQAQIDQLRKTKGKCFRDNIM